MLEDWQGVHTPGILYEFQNKGLTKLAFRKLLILNGAFSVDGSKWERHRRKEERHHGFGRSRRKRRIPEAHLPGHYSNGSEIASQGKRRGSSGSCRSAVQDGVPGVVDSRRNVLSAMQSGVPAGVHALRRLRRGLGVYTSSHGKWLC